MVREAQERGIERRKREGKRANMRGDMNPQKSGWKTGARGRGKMGKNAVCQSAIYCDVIKRGAKGASWGMPRGL